MKIYLVFIALFGVAAAELAEFTKCDDYENGICEVKEVRITPCRKDKTTCKLKKGIQSSIEVDYITQFDAEQLTSSLYWASQNGDVPFGAFSDVDACQYTSCPARSSQQQQLAYTLLLSKKLPTGLFTFKWKLWDSSDATKGCCFKTDVRLIK